MPSVTTNAFCADFSNTASCLFAIQAAQDSGQFAADPELLRLLAIFRDDAVRKLLDRSIRVIRLLNDTPAGELPGGDFDAQDFYYEDFFTGYLDERNTGYSSAFQSVVNMSAEFCARAAEISDADKAALNEAFLAVLDAFAQIQQYLATAGLNLCGTPAAQYFNNSPEVYLQCAGADGSGGIPAGAHLRWSLSGELGDNHLPKGNLALGDTGYNQPEDFIQISRTPYTGMAGFSLPLDTATPVADHAARQWSYLLTGTAGGKKLTNQVRLYFADEHAYGMVAAQINAVSDPAGFLDAYSGVLGVSILNKTFFKAVLACSNPAGGGTAYIKAEANCAPPGGGAEGHANVRSTRSLAPGESLEEVLWAENAVRLSLKKTPGCRLSALSFETYADLLDSTPEGGWVAVGNGFSLSLDDAAAFGRLEDSARPINGLWPQFNNGTRVRAANYRDKWLTSRPGEPSLKETVERYLELAEEDPRAQDIIREDGAPPTDPGFLLSYLDILRLMATDYHFARMLGLGHIDQPAGFSTGQAFVYRLRYHGRAEAGQPEKAWRTYLSLPVSKDDTLLPEPAQIRPVKYGLPDESQPHNAFDAAGYSLYERARAINIGRMPYPEELEGHNFFAQLEDIENSNIFKHPRPAFYGIEYRGEGDTGYAKPEITQEKAMGTAYYAFDDGYPDSGIPETVPVPDEPDSLFIHMNRRPGVQYYAIYGINWFSRASALSAEVATEPSVFPLRNDLRPPADLSVQYVQKEDTPLFTSGQEQAWLLARQEAFPGLDTGFTRVTFNWPELVDASSLPVTGAAALEGLAKADTVQCYFKPGPVMEVAGAIGRILPVPAEEAQLYIHTAPFRRTDGSYDEPFIPQAALGLFTDSALNTDNGTYRVLSIDAGDPWPVLKIEKIMEPETVPDGEGGYGISQAWYGPESLGRFTLVENLGRTGNWEALSAVIPLHHFADAASPVIETTADSEGNASKLWVGGIHGQAVVTPLFDGPLDENGLPGHYLVTFEPGTALAPHPQANLPFDPAAPGANSPAQARPAHVEWYKGLLRAPRASAPAEKKTLEVLRIEQLSPLVAYVFDPDFYNDPIAHSQDETDTIGLNFHPGYRAYLFSEPAPGGFNRAQLLPAGNDNDKRTLLGLRVADTRNGLASQVSAPAVLLARNIQEPQPLEMPVSGSLKVRPDATGLAAFTFDIKAVTQLNGSPRQPFGFRFYRTAHTDILEALYAPATVAGIQEALAALDEDIYYDLRYAELANLVDGPGTPGFFRAFHAQPTAYGFPVPDKPGLSAPGDTLAQRKAKYAAAIAATFLPLTEQPPVFQFIKEGRQTENTAPRIRDIDGNLLDMDDSRFNPFPMVRRFTEEGQPGHTTVRFTDYTLNGNSRFLYFYAGVEISNQLVPGSLSPLAGPVNVLQTLASEAPSVISYRLQPGTGPESPLSISFDIAPMAPGDHHSELRLYRTPDARATYALSEMGEPVSFEIAEEGTETFTVTDTLDGIGASATGQTLYYRIAAARLIINEHGLPEKVLSLGSAPIPIRVIDTFNPEPPQLSYDAPSHTLHWQATANRGTYTVLKQNSRGNWAAVHNVNAEQAGDQLSYVLPGPLPAADEESNPIYHRFKVRAENSSGLMNLTDKELTI